MVTFRLSSESVACQDLSPGAVPVLFRLRSLVWRLAVKSGMSRVLCVGVVGLERPRAAAYRPGLDIRVFILFVCLFWRQSWRSACGRNTVAEGERNHRSVT